MADLKGTYTSPHSNPTFKYDISYKETGRTSSTVTYNVTVSTYMTYSSSYYGYNLNGYIKVGGKQETVFAKPASEKWKGTTKHTYSKSVTCNASATSGTVPVKFWTTVPGSPGKSGLIEVEGTFTRSAHSSSDGGSPEPPSPPPTPPIPKPPSSTGNIFKLVGGQWKDYCDIKGINKYEGGKWNDAKVLKRISDKWVQIYPTYSTDTGGGGGNDSGGGSTGSTIIVKGGTHRYKNKTKNWEAGVAKQGDWGYGACYGVFGISRKQFRGNGTVSKVSSAYITGYRDASGYYNNNQTIKFYRSSNSGSGDTIKYAGSFTSTTGAPGADRNMSGNRTISGLDNVKDFLNGVSGYDNLLIYASAKSDYLGLKNVSLGIKYDFKPVVAYFDNPKKVQYMTEGQLKDEAINNPYLTMLLYPDEINLTLDEILKRRLMLGIADIDNTTVKQVEPHDEPYAITYKVENGILNVEMKNIFENRIPQYSLDGHKWHELVFNPITTLYNGTIHSSYENIYIRVINQKTDELLYEHTYDKPKIDLVI